MTDPRKKSPIRRLAIASSILFVLVIMAAIWWDAHPPDDSSFLPPPRPAVPPTDNGTTLLRNLQVPHDSLTMADLSRRSEMIDGEQPWDAPYIASILASNQTELDTLDRALASPSFILEPPPPDRPQSELFAIQSLARLKLLAAHHAAHTGDQAAAVSHLIDIGHLAHRTRRAHGGIVALLVSLTTTAIADTHSIKILPHITDSDQLRRLSAALEKYKTDPADLEQTLRIQFNHAKTFVASTGRIAVYNRLEEPSPHALGWLFYKPNATLHHHLAILVHTAGNLRAPHAAATATSPTVAAIDAYPTKPWHRLNLNHNGKRSARAALSVWQSIEGRHWRGKLHHTAAQLLIALHLYQLDHQNQLPPSLTDLVPTYLPHLPHDPYNGASLNYDPNKRLIWSVGENRTNNGGHLDPADPHRIDWDNPTFHIPQPTAPPRQNPPEEVR